jgi:hypothetical protein
MQRDNTESRAYPCKCLTFGCLPTTGVFNFRLPSNDGIRPNTSQYACKHEQTQAWVRTHTRTGIHTHSITYKLTKTQTHMNRCKHTSMHIYTPAYIKNTYEHRHTNTRMDMNMPTQITHSHMNTHHMNMHKHRNTTATILFFMVKGLKSYAQPPSYRASSCRASKDNYSMY